MQKLDRSHHLTRHTFLTAEDCDLADLATLCESATDPADYPFAARAEKGVLVYDCPGLLPHIHEPVFAAALDAQAAKRLP